MILIRRTKSAPAGPDKIVPPPAVHFAAKLRGDVVTAWTADRAGALAVDAATAAAVRDRYAGNESAVVECVGADDAPATLAPPKRTPAEAELAAYLDLPDAPPAEVARVALHELRLLEAEVKKAAPPKKPAPRAEPKAEPPKEPNPTADPGK